MAFSLALLRIYDEPDLPNHPDEHRLRKTMLTAVTFLVLFTVFVQVGGELVDSILSSTSGDNLFFQGSTIKPLVKLIKVKTATESKPSLNEVVHGTVSF